MIPHERSLVKKMEGKPFALIGVNTDGDRNMVKQRSKKDRVTWRSFYDGKTGKIPSAWKVQGFPTLYLIDHQGVVRKMWLGGPNPKELEAEIDKLVKAAEKAKSTS